MASDGTGSTPAVSLHQPWATAIAQGWKTIETRSWPAKTLIGRRVAIHAAARRPNHRLTIGKWVVSDPPGYRHGPHAPYVFSVGHTDSGKIVPLPLGAVVAVATVVEMAPMVDLDSYRPGERVPLPAIVRDRDEWSVWWGCTLGELDEQILGRGVDIDDELAWGLYEVGRWGWLLGDVTPVVPVPCRGRQGVWRLAAETAAELRSQGVEL